MTALTKITSKSSCQHCGAALRLATSGRRKRFCSDRCRLAFSRRGISEQESGVEGSSGRVVAKTKKCSEMASQPIEAKEIFFHEIRISKNLPPHTYKLTEGIQINVPVACNWSGYRTARAFGWVTSNTAGKWFARCGNRGIGPVDLKTGKAAAFKMVEDRNYGDALDDWIALQNLAVVSEIDRVSAAMSINDDGTYNLKVSWGDGLSQKFPNSVYPEDDAVHILHEWGYRGTLSLRW